MSKFYTLAWQQRGTIFLKLIEAAADKIDSVKIYKEGRNTNNIFEREVAPKDCKTKTGYRFKVWSQDEKRAQDSETLQKLNVAKATMPFNTKLAEIYKRKLVEFADLTPDEINEVMEQEEQNEAALLNQTLTAGAQPGQPQTGLPAPVPPPPNQAVA